MNLRVTALGLAAHVQDPRLQREEGKSEDPSSYPARLCFNTAQGKGDSSEDSQDMFKALGSGVQSQELQRK